MHILPSEPKATERHFTQAKEASLIREILRGEISATEVYKQIIERQSGLSKKELEEALCDHQTAVNFWRKQMSKEGLDVDESSGPWGSIVETFVCAAQLLGEKASLAALKEGEEYGLKEYRELIQGGQLSSDRCRYVKSIFIPNQREHIENLKNMMDS